MRFVPGLLAALLVAVAAGCGQSGVAGSAGAVVPESAVAYVSVDTSFEGDQWRALSGLLERFPDGEGLVDELLEKASAEAGLGGGADLRAALGPEVALVVLDEPAAAGDEPPVVVLTQPGDEAAFADLVEGAGAARAEVQGWQAVAETEADLERYREALDAGSLEGSQAFEEAMDGLPAEALARVYVNGAGAGGLTRGISPLPLDASGGSLGAAVVAEDDGVRVEGRAIAAGEDEAPELDAYRSELVEEIPAGAVAFLSFNDLGSALEQFAGSLDGGMALPFDPGEVGGLLSGEIALYVRAGPTVTLLAEVDDEQAAIETVELLLGLAGGEAPIVYEAFDGLLAVSNSQAELDALRGDGPRLGGDDRFAAALEAAGMPDETTGFGYVDVEAAIPLVAGLAPVAGTADALPEAYLEPLGGLVFWGEPAGDAQRFSLFLAVE
ncbi:MAG TPA: hypothetical protein VD769_13775 [Gaiellaceae bacterium]|nr:hypothetical protein [Gaiellaceae bacterium]